MRPVSLRIIRLALAVQFICILAVPSLIAAAESPRGVWLAECLRPQAADLSPGARTAGERTIGVLRVRDGKLSFVEQIGQIEWELDLDRVEQVTVVNGGRWLSIVSVAGEEYVISIMNANMMRVSPKRVLAMIEPTAQSLAAHRR